MPKQEHILIVDDDEDIRDLLRQYLERNGLKVSTAAGGRQMRQVLAQNQIDLMVLDLMMPVEDGLVLCRELRAQVNNSLPILMLTAKNEEADRILGLEMGADDYLTKPFASRELLARIRAILRRTNAIPKSLQVTAASRYLRFSDWFLDTHTHHLLDAQKVTVSLSSAEYRLLKVLLEHPQRVLTRDQLLYLTQQREADMFDRSIDILISRLRKRLRSDASVNADGKAIELIKTVRNGGYMLASSVKALEELSWQA